MNIVAISEAAAKVVETGAEVSKNVAEISAHTAEFAETQIGEIAHQKDVIIKPDMITIKERSLKSVMVSNLEDYYHAVRDEHILELAKDKIPILTNANPLEGTETAPNIKIIDNLLEKVGLNDEQKVLVIKETDWPPAIVDCVESMKQYEVYKEANLHYTEINGRPCLIKNINMDFEDPKTGMNNRELLEKGRSPIDADTGEKIELHHMGQNFNSPFAELCENSEHGDGNDGILHDKKVESWRRDPELKNQYAVQRANHWTSRVAEV